MKKQIIAGIVVTACVAPCAAVWPRSTEVGDLPAEPVKVAVTAEFKALSGKTSEILLSANTSALEAEAVAENEPLKTEVTAEEKPEPDPAAKQMPRTVSKLTPVSYEPKPGDRAVIDGKPHIWIPGFEWVEDNGGGNAGTVAKDMYENGNKIGMN